MTKHVNRRLFLRGLGGAAVAVPFLSSVTERVAKSAGKVVASAPRRLVLYFTHYGCITDQWFPNKAHGSLTAADFAGKTTEALGQFADRILLPRGIRAMNQWDSTGRLGQQNDPHTQATGSILTCQPVSPDGVCSVNPDDCIIPDDGAAKNNARPIGRSLDHIAAEQVNRGGDAAPLVLKIGGARDHDASEISYSAPETPFAGHGSPAAVLSALTNLFVGDTVSPDSYRLARGKSVLDIVEDDLARLKRQDMSRSDRRKLEAWMELLHSTTNTLIGSRCSQELVDEFGLPGTSAPDSFADATSPGVTDLMMKAAVLSFLCDATRVVLMKYRPNMVYTGLGLTTEHDGLAHRIGTAFMGGPCGEGVVEALMNIDRFHAEKFAYLASLMDEFPESDGTLLDSAAAVWVQEFSDGSAMNLNNMPIVQIGSCGGYFRVGRAVNLEDGSPTMHQGNSSEDCADGETVPIQEGMHPAGTPHDIANRPINKYYCNLLNALGVKANLEGHPELGGIEEVRRFGKFDDTSLFRGGIDRPSEFVDEGEFPELKA